MTGGRPRLQERRSDRKERQAKRKLTAMIPNQNIPTGETPNKGYKTIGLLVPLPEFEKCSENQVTVTDRVE